MESSLFFFFAIAFLAELYVSFESFFGKGSTQEKLDKALFFIGESLLSSSCSLVSTGKDRVPTSTLNFFCYLLFFFSSREVFFSKVSASSKSVKLSESSKVLSGDCFSLNLRSRMVDLSLISFHSTSLRDKAYVSRQQISQS